MAIMQSEKEEEEEKEEENDAQAQSWREEEEEEEENDAQAQSWRVMMMMMMMAMRTDGCQSALLETLWIRQRFRAPGDLSAVGQMDSALTPSQKTTTILCLVYLCLFTFEIATTTTVIRWPA